MADNFEQLNAKTDELIRKVEDGLRAAYGLQQIAQGNRLGFMSGIDNLAQAPVGDAGAVRSNLGLGAAAVRNVGSDNGNVLEVGTYGVGSTCVFLPPGTDPRVSVNRAGFYMVNRPAVAPSPISDWYLILHLEHGGAGFSGQLWFNLFNPGDIYCSGRTGNNVVEFSRLYGSANTSTDGNGFIKRASPIFRLANKGEYAATDGMIPAGTGARNGEAEGVTATHDETGVYTVSGSLGFATDSWTIELPQDVNGNRLVFVKTETADDGTITVRTFGRKFDMDTASIVAGDPMDIPDNRWIDLRLSMPERPMPEIPMPKMPTPFEPTAAREDDNQGPDESPSSSE